MALGARNWLARRTGVDTLLERMRERQVPAAGVTHYMGAMLVFLFLVEVASGILLLLPYRPDPANAHASLVAIVGRLPYGALIRGIHVWANHFFVALLIAHLCVTLLLRRFREPNELIWWSGLLLLAVGLGMAFTGSILPWNQNAYLQARVSSEMIGQGPIFGPWLKHLLRGGEDVTPWTLNHAFGFHTGVLPAATTLVIASHIAFVQRRPREEGVATIPAHPDFTARVAAVATLLLVVLVSLATFAPISVGAPADPREISTGPARPPWYFLFLHELLRAAPPRLLGVDSAKFILGALSLLGLFVVALPLIDRKGSRITLFVGSFVILIAILL
ncbi:MAG: cytochrome b N-terminal domain-containing protein, partial [Polyangiaceae bacterium]